IIGVSKDPKKVGHIIFRNLIDSNFEGNLFLVNPFADIILNKKVYHSLLNIKENIELAVIALPAKKVPQVIKECGKKKIQNIIIISSGFKEMGNIKLEDEVKNLLEKYKIKCIGVNSLGIFDAYTKLDTLFLPRYRLKRPKPGNISFVSQSGALGLAILDLATSENYGIAKFISYGNATNIDESDILEFLLQDNNTKVICMYIEGVKDGRKFLEIAKKVSKVKPIIVIKGGITEKGKEAALSHTGALAGEAEVYYAAFKQANIIQANSLQEVFNFARILEKSMLTKGDRVQVITNGGGYGVLSIDSIIKNNLSLASLNKKTIEKLKKQLTNLVVISNPIDLSGDATTERYKIAIDACLDDNNVDILLLIVLYQSPLIDTSILDIITEAKDLKKKPIIVVSTGGEFTDTLKRSLEDNGVVNFTFPEDAVKAIKALTEYYLKR
ncbi:MAG: CoA-binding protein, partial [Nanoarchaeota archaeon]